MEPKCLDRAAILAADDRKTELVDVPEWGGQVRVTTISAKAHYDIMRLTENDEQGNTKFWIGVLLARTIVDEHDNQLFTEKDISALMNKSNKAIDRLVTAALKLNPFGNLEDAVQEAEKNSEGEAGDNSLSVSP